MDGIVKPLADRKGNEIDYDEHVSSHREIMQGSNSAPIKKQILGHICRYNKQNQ